MLQVGDMESPVKRGTWLQVVQYTNLYMLCSLRDVTSVAPPRRTYFIVIRKGRGSRYQWPSFGLTLQSSKHLHKQH
jgi:hypothetical protein